MLKLKVGDKVKVLLGRDRGREGEIEKVFPKKQMVAIPGMNMYKRSVKGFGDQKGGIYDLARPLAASKVALICPKCNKVTRVAFKMVGEEKKRVCVKCGREIDSAKKSKKK